MITNVPFRPLVKLHRTTDPEPIRWNLTFLVSRVDLNIARFILFPETHTGSQGAKMKPQLIISRWLFATAALSLLAACLFWAPGSTATTKPSAPATQDDKG